MQSDNLFKPQYLRIQDYIVDKIQSGEYVVGSKIPSEIELADMFAISRITANKALKELSVMGIVTRKRGLGTFVCEKNTPSTNSKAFGSAVNLKINVKRSHKLLQFRIIKPYPELIQDTNIPQNEDFYEIILANANGKNIESIDYSYIPCRLVPNMLQHLQELCDNFIFDFLKNYSSLPPALLKVFVNIPQYSFLKTASSFLPPESKNTEGNIQIWKTGVYDKDSKMLCSIFTVCFETSTETPLFTFLL